MSERSEYSPGEFSWVDLASPDVDVSAKFYGDLLGWETVSAGDPAETGGYGFFTFKGKMVAGYGPTMRDQPPAWSSYVTVSDADEAANKIKDAGGTVIMEPIEIPNDAGRMCPFQDAEGAFLCVFEPRKHKGAELVNEVGTWTWNQLASRDLEAAKRFYGDVFGWELTQSEEAPPDTPYFMWQVANQRFEEGLAGAMKMGDEMAADTPPHWAVYFAVEDADAVVELTPNPAVRTCSAPRRSRSAPWRPWSTPRAPTSRSSSPTIPSPASSGQIRAALDGPLSRPQAPPPPKSSEL
jgi:uncharacterized protein